MSDYTKNFYELYLDYLGEDTVRESHDSAFKYFLNNYKASKILDLGCGLSEFARYASPEEYLGIDLNAEVKKYNKNNIIIADYRNNNLSDLINPFKPDSAISLFSVEITAPKGVESFSAQVNSKYDMYVKVFRELPSVKVMLVSGFYYRNKMDENPIRENGGVVSYQTLEPKQEGYDDVFSELRFDTVTPSKMFGDDVVEIWKVLERA